MSAVKNVWIVAGLLACLVLAGCNAQSSEFKQRGQEALDSLKRLDDAHLKDVASYRAHLVQAENAVDAVWRAQGIKGETDDWFTAMAMNQYFDAIKADRERAEYEIGNLERTSTTSVRHKTLLADYQKASRVRTDELEARRAEFSDRLNGTFANK